MGQAPPGEECNVTGNGTPFVKAGEFGESRPIIREWTTKPLRFAKSADVLVCVVGATCGKLNLGADCAIGRSVAAIRPNASLLNQGFLYAFLQGWTVRLRTGSQGSAQGVITREMIGSIPIPVPPLAEQERIVKLLDEADELRKLRAQADRRTADLIPALFHEMFGDPATNSKGWPIRAASDLMEACDYGTSQKANEAARGIPVLRMGNVTTSGELDLTHLKTVELPEKELTGQRLKAGDVLFNRTNSRELVGKTGMWDGRFEAVAASYFIRVRFLPDIEHPQHFTTFMNLPFMKQRLTEIARGAVGQANINSKELKAIPVPVPPVSQQTEFARRVMKIRELEASQTASRLRLEILFQSMLHRAFNGELTGGTEVVELQSSQEFIRTVLAAEIVSRMHGDRTFGQVKLQKVIHLAEYIVPIEEISSEPERFAAGPHDPKLIAQVETKMKDCDWYEAAPRADGYGNEYRPLTKAGGHREHFEKLWPKQAAAIRRLIDEMKTWKTERCERFATVYAAWNDLLIWGKQADDAAILDQVLNHWHTAKQQIPKASWMETLTWMKREGYIPTGFGRATAPKPQADLFPS